MADEGQTKKKFPSSWFVILVLVVIAGLYFRSHYEIRLDDERGIVVNRRNGDDPPAEEPANTSSDPAGKSDAIPQPDAVKEVPPLTRMTIATWDLTPLNFEKLSDEKRAQLIADVVSQFDLIAVQGVVRTTQPLDELIRRINGKGKKYAYVVPKNIGAIPEYVAFLFDTTVVKYDPAKTREIDAPTLSYRPLVASFCTVQPPSDKAFTFNLVNVKIPDDRKDIETAMLGRIFREVRDGDTAEDDIIMLGNFGKPVQQIDSLRDVPYLNIVHENLPTTIDGMDSTENIVFDGKRTGLECIGNVQRVDLIKLFDLKLAEVGKIAEHLPISAEFSVFEAISPKPE